MLALSLALLTLAPTPPQKVKVALEGHVVHADGSPAPGAFAWIEPRPRRGRKVIEVTAGAEGRFRSRPLAPGRYAVEVGLNHLAYSPAVPVELGPESPALVLALPPIAELSGVVAAPEGASFAGLRIYAIPDGELGPGPAPENYMLKLGPSARIPSSPLDADGRFRVVHLPADPVTVFLSLPTIDWRYPNGSGVPMPGPAEVVARVALNPGSNVLAVDLKDRFPGFVELSVTRDGRRCGDLAVYATRVDKPAGGHVPLRLDADGRGLFGPLFAGEWSLAVHDQHPPYAAHRLYGYPHAIRVPSGSRAPVSVDFTHACGVLQLADSSGRAQVGVAGLFGSVLAGYDRVETDARGRVSLELIPGPYEVILVSEPWKGADPLRFEWTAEGPVPKTLTVD